MSAPPDPRPSHLSRALALAAASLAALVALADGVGAAVAGLGVVGILLGTVLPSRTALDAGGTALALGVALAAGTYAGAAVPLAGVVAAVTAWDLGGSAVTLGAELGRDADTRRLEAVGAATTVGVGVLAAGTGLALYRVAFRGLTFTTLALLLAAALLLAYSLQE